MIYQRNLQHPSLCFITVHSLLNSIQSSLTQSSIWGFTSSFCFFTIFMFLNSVQSSKAADNCNDLSEKPTNALVTSFLYQFILLCEIILLVTNSYFQFISFAISGLYVKNRSPVYFIFYFGLKSQKNYFPSLFDHLKYFAISGLRVI